VKVTLPRYRWWLLIVCLAAGIGVIGWWLLSARPVGRFTRGQYDQIRLGMTPAEVASSIGSVSSGGQLMFRRPGRAIRWDLVAREGAWPPNSVDKVNTWGDESVVIGVFYRDGKAIFKQMETSVPLPLWKAMAHKCRDWLRRLVGWFRLGADDRLAVDPASPDTPIAYSGRNVSCHPFDCGWCPCKCFLASSAVG
jgi:hypothetical protein